MIQEHTFGGVNKPPSGSQETPRSQEGEIEGTCTGNGHTGTSPWNSNGDPVYRRYPNYRLSRLLDFCFGFVRRRKF